MSKPSKARTRKPRQLRKPSTPIDPAELELGTYNADKAALARQHGRCGDCGIDHRQHVCPGCDRVCWRPSGRDTVANSVRAIFDEIRTTGARRKQTVDPGERVILAGLLGLCHECTKDIVAGKSVVAPSVVHARREAGSAPVKAAS